MARHFHGPVTLTIPSGQTESAEIKGRDGTRLVAQADLIAITAPDTLPEVVNAHAAPSEAPAAGDYAQATSAAIAANTIATIQGGLGKAMKLVAGGAVAADRVFTVVFIYNAVGPVGV